MIDFAKILRSAGLTVTEEPGWRTAGHASAEPFEPVGGIWHHTAGLDAQGVVVNGRADLAGPLANLYLRRDGSVHVVCAGVAWHAGEGSLFTMMHIAAGRPMPGGGEYAAELGLNDDYAHGNRQLVGVEVEAMGDHSPYPQAQVRALVTLSAALCVALDWSKGDPAGHWAHHREWTKRKVDMDLADTTDLRALVRARLKAQVPVIPPSGGATEGDDPVIILTTPTGPDHRPAAVLVATSTGPLARTLSQNEWRALSRLHDANPAAVVIEERPAVEHDYLTGYKAEGVSA